MMTNTSSPYYEAAIIGRNQQLEWLLSHEFYYTRDCHENGQYLSWNVKLYDIDLEFEHLVAIHQKSGYGDHRRLTDKKWLGLAKEQYKEHHKANLFDYAVDDARQSLQRDDTYKYLWDGTSIDAEFSFVGRSGGHLVLCSFANTTITKEQLIVEEDNDEETGCSSLTDKEIELLYRFVVQCDHDFSRQAVKSEVEYLTAFTLFENLLTEVPLDPLPEEDLGINI